MNIEIDIDNLTLTGFGPLDRRMLDQAMRRELAQLIATHGLSMADGNVDQLDGGTIELAPDASPAEVGASIARAVYGALI